MRFGKKANSVETKKTRSCVVRLEKVSRASTSPPSTISGRTPTSAQRAGTSTAKRGRKHSIGSSVVMGATPKQPAAAAHSREDKNCKGPIKKRPVGSGGNQQTPQQKQSTAATSMSAIRSNQKIKVIPRSRGATPQAATPVREETPTPTIAAGRSRRAIKPNPKYASEDMVTPKMMRNVGTTKSIAGTEARQRKLSTSSEDFYNNNSDDEYGDYAKNMSSNNDDMSRDKAYKLDERDAALDSDISEIEQELQKRVRMRGRPRKSEVTATTNASKAPTSVTNSSAKRISNSASLPVRTAPTQLQQLRRSLASANAQRNQSLLAGSSSVAPKRKLEESFDSDDSEEVSYTVPRKQLMVSTSSGAKVRVPVKQNSTISSSTNPSNRHRVLGVQKAGSTPIQPLNGKPQNSLVTEKRKMVLSTKTSVDLPARMAMRSTLSNRQQQSMAGGGTNTNSVQTSGSTTKPALGKSIATNNRALRTASPRPSSTNSSAKVVTSSSLSADNSQLQKKKLPTLPLKPAEKIKSASSNSAPLNSAPSSKAENIKAKPSSQKATSNSTLPSAIVTSQTVVINEESPNSTMDDFETMPTFTIVNVNDIINKKGDVLITKSKTSPISGPKATVIEFSESISLDEEEDDDDFSDAKKKGKCNNRDGPPVNNKLSTSHSRVDVEKKKAPLHRTNNEIAARKSSPTTTKVTAPAKPQILNHRLGLRNNQRVTAKTTATAPPSAPEKPAPRILNSVVAKKTQPVKPMIANLDDSAEESFPLSLDEEETDDEAESKSYGQNEKKAQSYSMELDTEDTESQNTEHDEQSPPKALTPKNTSIANTTSSPSPQSAQRRRRPANTVATPIVVTSNKKRIPPAAAKENSLAATNQQVNDSKSSPLMPQTRKAPTEKVVISKQGDKIIKKITCFETWYVLNMPLEPKRQTIMRNMLDVPLIKLANIAKTISLPSDMWSCKVTLYELSAMTLAKSTFVTYTGDLAEYNINEEDRGKYQPSCVMFRRSAENRQISRMPYDRAVIFKNKTFSTNIEGKNIRLLGAPNVISSEREIEILLEVVDALTLQSDFVEYATALQ